MLMWFPVCYTPRSLHAALKMVWQEFAVVEVMSYVLYRVIFLLSQSMAFEMHGARDVKAQ